MPHQFPNSTPPPSSDRFASSVDACPITGKAGRAWIKNAKTVYGHKVSAEAADTFAFLRRFAFGADFVLYLIATGILAGFFGGKAPAFIWWITWVIFCTKDGWNQGQSPGKMMFGLRVMNEHTGKPIDAMQSFLRNVPLLIWIPLFDSGIWLPIGIFWAMAGIEAGKRAGDGVTGAKVVWLEHEKSVVFDVGAPTSRRDRQRGGKPVSQPWSANPFKKLGETLNELQHKLDEYGKAQHHGSQAPRADQTPYQQQMVSPPPIIRPHEQAPAPRTGGAVYRGRPELHRPGSPAPSEMAPAPPMISPPSKPSPYLSPSMPPPIEVPMHTPSRDRYSKPAVAQPHQGSGRQYATSHLPQSPDDLHAPEPVEREFAKAATRMHKRYAMRNVVVAGAGTTGGFASERGATAKDRHDFAHGNPHLSSGNYDNESQLRTYDNHNVSAIDVADENGGFRHALYVSGLDASHYQRGANFAQYNHSAAHP